MFSYTYQLLLKRKTYKLIIAVVFILNCLTSFSQEYKKIKAQKGDGIYSVLKQNGLPANEYLDQFIKLNKTKLGKKNALIVDRIYLLPIKVGKDTVVQKSAPVKESVSEKKNYEIFGENYKEVVIKSKELSGAVYYLLSGHGGPDPGAIGTLNGHILCEDEYAYDVTLRLARNLTELGATVYMITRDPNDGIRDDQFLTPDKDEICFPDQPILLNQLDRLHQGTEAINRLYAQNKGKFQRMVTIHVDSRDKEESIDVFFYNKKGSKPGEKLANTLRDIFGLRYSIHRPNREYQGSVSDRSLYVLRKSLPTSVFVEIGNINNTRDQQRIINPDNRQAVSNWLRDGLIKEYQNTPKKNSGIKVKTKGRKSKK